MTDNDRSQALFGNPYVGWSPRPLKNGQPAPCYGQCNLNIGARKVGAALRRYPQIFMSPKSKDQILQKWDPVSKSLLNIYVHPPPPPPAAVSNVTITPIPPLYELAIINFDSTKPSDGQIDLYTNSSNMIEGAQFQTSIPYTSETSIPITQGTGGQFGVYYFAVVTPTGGLPVYSPIVYVPNVIQSVTLVQSGSDFIVNWTITTPRNVTLYLYRESSIGTGFSLYVYSAISASNTSQTYTGVAAPGYSYYVTIEDNTSPSIGIQSRDSDVLTL